MAITVRAVQVDAGNKSIDSKSLSGRIKSTRPPNKPALAYSAKVDTGFAIKIRASYLIESIFLRDFT
ncbi:MAG: hypothetical protein K5821_05660 [Nitrobacter sp.]|nr:hypothetical protein [Nitrobacter sp.]MCV0385904.1 hypothetical protein [Nitrobacter sp.]